MRGSGGGSGGDRGGGAFVGTDGESCIKVALMEIRRGVIRGRLENPAKFFPYTSAIIWGEFAKYVPKKKIFLQVIYILWRFLSCSTCAASITEVVRSGGDGDEWVW